MDTSTKPTGSARLHFARFEFKYVLSQRLREEVEAELGYFMDLDPYVSSAAEGSYFVRSLYFDDPAYTAFYDKIDGLRSRFKFRLRTYTDQPGDGTPLFLEVKRRTDNLVTKDRVVVDLPVDNEHERGSRLAETVLASAAEGPVCSQFAYDLYRRRLRPVALIDYRRRPYISRFDPEFRLTMDDRLQCTAADSLFPSRGQCSRQGLPGYAIMEVKFRFHVPSWFHRIIQSYELRRVSISKICRGMDVLELAENLS